LEMERGKSETLDLLRRQIQQLVRLVDEVLDVSRLMRSKITLRKESIVLQELIQELSTLVQPTLVQRKSTLHLTLPSEPITLQVDPQRMLQALSELVYQRSKNMPTGGSLTLSVERSAQGVVLRFQDTGQAIDSDLLPHLFDVHAQVQHSMKSNRTHLELGLALAGGLIALHGGQIQARPNVPSPGMQFVIYLPL
jgi:signal transduction histidine kinase